MTKKCLKRLSTGSRSWATSQITSKSWVFASLIVIFSWSRRRKWWRRRIL